MIWSDLGHSLLKGKLHAEDYTHPKLLDSLRKVEVIVDQMMKGALY